MPESPTTEAATPAPGTTGRLSAIEILAFLVELVGVVSLAFWGFVAWPFPWNIVVGIAAPVAAMVIWGLFVSPRAVFRVHPFVRAVVELLIYVSVTVAWWSLGATWVGLAFGVVAVTVGLIAGRRRFA